ncbi:leucine-rich repeat-containing protein 51 [Nilaparvata lugens]|uniref:leucine-rich repeat-containing protein 51 n=1 Tax=Nilaparvata lugens TaxID=108931 RepID=UPI00193D9D68|nr:leucine-rich repeat-containing protein 51 [Nilaparvata lugens]XP_039278739.1 leucine-rich repeat-containing protein 51 [Nilaparvata lugens]
MAKTPEGKHTGHHELKQIPPLDYSFKKLELLTEDILREKPRGSRTKYIPRRGSNERFVTASIWLNNNRIVSVDGLHKLINALLEYPSRLTWLDLSFNRIEFLSKDLKKFPSLRILYLHGNRIKDIKMVAFMLGVISTLRTLTLHGNPIDATPYYRNYILKTIPQLMSLDFVMITMSERLAPAPPHNLINERVEKMLNEKSREVY